MNRSSIALVALLATPACEDARDLASGTPLAAVPGDVRFVVRHSDYTSSAYSLLGVDGDVVVDGYVHSGSTAPGLSATLSGDTDVPTVSEPGILTIIDRYGTDVVTRIRLATGEVLGQVRVQGTSTSGFSANPQDVVYVSANSAWVTRYGHNTMVGAPADVAGSDLVEFDPATMTRTGDRVDLAGLEQDVMVGANTLVARVGARRVVRVGNYLAVGLDLIAEDYSTAAPGTLAVVAVETGAVTSFAVGALNNCGGILPVPGAPTQVAIVCSGYSDTATESGVVIVQIDGIAGTVTEVARYESADHAGEAPVFDSVVMIDADEFVGVNIGGFLATDPPDTLVHVDMTTGTRTTLLTAASASALFVTMAYDPDSGLLLVPESGVGIRRYRRGSAGAFTAESTVTLSGRGLGAVGVSLFP